MMESDQKLFNVSFWAFFKAAVLILSLWALWILRDLVAVVLLSIVIASAIEPAARWFKAHKIPRLFGVLFIYLAGITIFLLIFYLVIPPLLGDLLDFLSTLPSFIETTFRPNSPIFSFFPEFPAALSGYIKDLALALEGYIPQITDKIFSSGSAIFGGALSFILLIVLSFYLSVQEHGIESFLRLVTPLEKENYILDLWKRSQRKIGRWLQGQILLGVLIGVFVFLGLTILDVKYAIFLGILSAIFEIIPVFGPVMAAIPAIAIASIQKPVLGLMVLGLFIIVQQFENHLIYPLVVRKTVGVPPLLVVISLVAGFELGGFFGVILSVPAASVLVEFLNDLAIERQSKRK